MTNNDINKKSMIEALEKSLGIVTSACKAVGISRETHYRWLREDFAESQLHKQIKEGEVSSTIFFLKTKGKRRGYVERQEIDTNIAPINITISDKI